MHKMFTSTLPFKGWRSERYLKKNVFHSALSDHKVMVKTFIISQEIYDLYKTIEKS